MANFYSKSTLGFYSDALHKAMPPDAVAVTDAAYAALMTAQAAGQQITPDANGNPVASARPVVVLPIRVSPRQFRALFTSAEMTAIYIAAHAAMAMTPPQPALQIWIDDLSSATIVSLSDPDTIAGVNALVTAGLLTAARGVQILAGTAAPAA